MVEGELFGLLLVRVLVGLMGGGFRGREVDGFELRLYF